MHPVEYSAGYWQPSPALKKNGRVASIDAGAKPVRAGGLTPGAAQSPHAGRLALTVIKASGAAAAMAPRQASWATRR
jgi:hypothetical protein